MGDFPLVSTKTMRILSLILLACIVLRPAPSEGSEPPLQVVATTTLVGDVARVVGGEDIHLMVLLRPGQDPHTFEPSSRHAAGLFHAELILANGLGLEAFLSRLLSSSGAKGRLVEVSRGVDAIEWRDGAEHVHAHGGEACDEMPHDPHVWFDPGCVQVWVDRIEEAFSELRPHLAERFRARARDYKRELAELDAWISGEVAAIPPARRRLVADHRVLAYFSRRYGFEQPAVVIESFSTMANPSARHLARIEDVLRRERIPAIFAGVGSPQGLIERIARDTQVKVVLLYTGSLGEADGPASSYLEFMRHNTRLICEGLGEGP